MKPYFQEGDITIYNSDCRDVLPHVGRFDLCLTDPPYGIGASKMTLGNGLRVVERGDADWDAERPSVAIFTLARAVCKNSVVWGGNYFADILGASRGWLVWDKGTGDNDYADCELAWSDLDTVVKKYFRSWVGVNAKESADPDRFHPTQKPVELMLWCIQKAKNPQSVIDPFLGSGTTLVACKKLGIRGVGIEREEKYCELAVKRILNTTPSLFSEER